MIRILLWPKGLAEVVELDGMHTALIATVSTLPGSTIRGTIEGGTQNYIVKVRGCRKQDDTTDENPRFRIEGRFVNLRRAAKARLEKG